jgi:hypothetical protein
MSNRERTTKDSPLLPIGEYDLLGLFDKSGAQGNVA